MGALTLQLLSWIAARPRTYAEAMDAWRSTCPRHSVWEDALIDRLIEVETSSASMDQSVVRLTPAGRAALEQPEAPGASAVSGPDRRILADLQVPQLGE